MGFRMPAASFFQTDELPNAGGVSCGPSCLRQDWPTVAGGALAPCRNRPAVAGRLARVDGLIHADPDTSKSRGSAVFVASPNSVSRRWDDVRRQPPERLREHSRQKPGTPHYGFGWSATSKHLLRSSQSHKTDQTWMSAMTPGPRREPLLAFCRKRARRTVSHLSELRFRRQILVSGSRYYFIFIDIFRVRIRKVDASR